MPADAQKAHISVSINGLNQKGNSERVRANVCPHSAITLALTAESTINKGIEKKYEGMRAKMKKNFYGRELQKLNSNGLKRYYCNVSPKDGVVGETKFFLSY
ncbi:hypothetical protein A4V03_01980 [Bacteroides caecimuris]|uniref:Uncharacterized protein n=1 Tax=Bacteroides caecimuris TaxID=1796613 RepID=A0A1C7GY70_9BACE|nr:hypothetical protein A4V03_01980 [Bacteroides caecimuris]